MCVGTSDAEGTDRCLAHCARHGLADGDVQLSGGIDGPVELGEIGQRRDLLLVEDTDSAQEPGHACGSIEMADVRFHRSQCAR